MSHSWHARGHTWPRPLLAQAWTIGTSAARAHTTAVLNTADTSVALATCPAWRGDILHGVEILCGGGAVDLAALYL
eukprot:1161734-Pelagomonas_calceolata.AAC.22